MFEHLIQEIIQWEEVEAIALGGSRAKEHFDEASDYDVYIYIDTPIDPKKRKAVLEKYCSVLELGNHFWEEEDNAIMKDGIAIDLLYRNLHSFDKEIERVVLDHEPRNGYTTSMWDNLETSKILFDRSKKLEQLQRKYALEYPSALKEAIKERQVALLYKQLPNYYDQIKKAIERDDLVSMNHRSAAFMESYFDLLFAMNGIKNPGEKRLIELAKNKCAQLPAHFESNITHYFHQLYSDPRSALVTLRQIVEELITCFNIV